MSSVSRLLTGAVLSALVLFGCRDGDSAAKGSAAPHEVARSDGHHKGPRSKRASRSKRSRRTLEQALTKGSSMLAVLPDTQGYSAHFPGIFAAQTAWIRAHAAELDIRYVVHLGDVVNEDQPREWRRASDAMRLLDGVVPYAVTTGNHDYSDRNQRQTHFNEFFSFEKASSTAGFGGAYRSGKLENTYHLFSAAGHAFILLSLEWGPRQSVVDWANKVMDQYADRLGILATHAYLYSDNRRYDHTNEGLRQRFGPHHTTRDSNDGEELWQKLVRRHRFVMVLSGHVLGDGEGYLESRTDVGSVCHQMLSNYQTRKLGGQGYLRLIEFSPRGPGVEVFTYSPLYDRLLRGKSHELSFDLEPGRSSAARMAAAAGEL